MMQTLFQFVFSSQINLLQVIISALMGSLVGEIKKEIVEDDDDTPPKMIKFISEIIVATFIGTIISILLIEFNFFKDRPSIILIISSISGYLGYKNTFNIFINLIKLYAKSKNLDKELNTIINDTENIDIKKSNENTTDSNDDIDMG